MGMFQRALISAVLFASPSLLAANYVPGEYVVQLKSSSRSTLQLAKALAASSVESIRGDMVLVKKGTTRNPISTLKELNANPLVKIAEHNFIYTISRTPADPDYGKLWGMSNSGAADSANHPGVAGMDLNMESAWDVSTGSKNVVVAVIDTGIDTNHSDLKNNIWTNQAEANGKPGVDDDGNGYVDDVHGFDFVKNNGNVVDENGHGSHCAGSIGAEGSNGIGVAGVNWNVRMMGVRFLDEKGSGTLDNAIKAIDYARKNKVQVMSNSWGGGSYSALLEKAIQDANSAGILFVAAAGNASNNNDAKASYPASYQVENIVSVAALDNAGELAVFSNYGASSVHVAAPGVHIWSTSLNGGYKDLSGTSMATPHVSGVAALVIANENCQSLPCTAFSPKELRDRLINTSRPLFSLSGIVASGGIVDAHAALLNQKPPPDLNNPANWESQSAVSISTPHPYVNSTSQTFEISAPGATEIALHFSKFETEANYDSIKVYDAAGVQLGQISGVQTGRYSVPYKSDKLTLVFNPDASLPGYGFDIDYVKYR